MEYFQQSKRKISNIVGEELEVFLTTSPRSTKGDVGTIVEMEELDAGTQKYDVDREEKVTSYSTQQTTVQIQNKDGEYYARCIVHYLQEYGVALIEWVEIVDDECRGHGIGRMLHEELVEYIDLELGAEVIYTKIENSKMQGPALDSGFRQVESPTKEPWYKRG